MFYFKLGLLLFWALWFAIVLLTNLFGGLRAMGKVPADHRFASKNYEAVTQATAIYQPPRWLPPLLFIAVVVWQLVMAGLFGWAFASSFMAGSLNWPVINAAFAGGIALWAAFMLADEITLKYEFERTHELLFVAQLGCLGAVHLLPD